MTPEASEKISNALKIEIGKRFRQMRLYVGISQKEIADIFGMNQSNIARIEKGIVSPNMLICHYFKTHYNINTNWLISGRGNMVLPGSVQDPAIDYGEFTEEVLDLLFYLDRVPEVRLAVLKYFVGYKLENKKQLRDFLEQQQMAMA